MPSNLSENKIIIANAGSRKTSQLISDSLKNDKQKLLTTYTIMNTNQIKNRIIEKTKALPPNITIQTWYTFLLRDCIRPYQRALFKNVHIKSIDFDSTKPIGIKKTDPRYFLNKNNDIYKDYLADFAYQANIASNGSLIKRLENIYSEIYIDEVQDLSSWDLNFVEELLQSNIKIYLVGDPRQATFKTSNSSKNNSISGINLEKWIYKLEKKNLIKKQIKTECFRSNQKICDFADQLYPNLPKAESKFLKKTEHDGVFVVHPLQTKKYIETYEPQELLWSGSDDYISAINMGESKGKTFDRVLIYPTKTIKKAITTENYTILKPVTLAKLYVALTRARYSVGIVLDHNIPLRISYLDIKELVQKKPEQLGLF